MTSMSEVREAALRKAILDDLIVYKVQPILDARTGKLIAGETLARWQSSNAEDEELLTTENYLKKLCLLEWEEPSDSPLAAKANDNDGLTERSTRSNVPQFCT